MTLQNLSENFRKIIINIIEHYNWRRENYMKGTPQIIKEYLFKKYAIDKAQWIETGTYLGTTTKYLSENYSHIYSIEPNSKYYQKALLTFKGKNVTLYNDESQNILPKLLPSLSCSINFWLDGHYSGGDTYKGKKDTPIEDELHCIEKNISKFDNLVIFIDDIRLFFDNSQNSYPTVDYLVNFTKKLNMRWRIQHDIFIIYN
jgi:hypothetical protein